MVGPVPTVGFSVPALLKIRYLILNDPVEETFMVKFIIALLTESFGVYVKTFVAELNTTSGFVEEESAVSFCRVTGDEFDAAGVAAAIVKAAGIANVCMCVNVVPRIFVPPNTSLRVTCKLKFDDGVVMPEGILPYWSPFAKHITR